MRSAGVGNNHIPDIGAGQVLGTRQHLFSEEEIRRMGGDDAEQSTFSNVGGAAHIQQTGASLAPVPMPPPAPMAPPSPDVIQVREAKPTPPPSPPSSHSKPASKKKSSLPIIITLSVVLAAVVIIGGIALFRCNKKKGIRGGDSYSALYDVLENGGRSAVFSELSS